MSITMQNICYMKSEIYLWKRLGTQLKKIQPQKQKVFSETKNHLPPPPHPHQYQLNWNEKKVEPDKCFLWFYVEFVGGLYRVGGFPAGKMIRTKITKSEQWRQNLMFWLKIFCILKSSPCTPLVLCGEDSSSWKLFVCFMIYGKYVFMLICLAFDFLSFGLSGMGWDGVKKDIKISKSHKNPNNICP